MRCFESPKRQRCLVAALTALLIAVAPNRAPAQACAAGPEAAAAIQDLQRGLEIAQAQVRDAEAEGESLGRQLQLCQAAVQRQTARPVPSADTSAVSGEIAALLRRLAAARDGMPR